MAKFTIFLPDGLLTELDDYAEQVGESRSGVIREASALYLAQQRSGEAQAARVGAVRESLELFEKLAAQPSIDGRSSLEILRDLRGPLAEDDS